MTQSRHDEPDWPPRGPTEPAKRVTIHVASVEYDKGPGGMDTDLTTLPYLVFGSDQEITYAATAATAAVIRHGGQFSCTITKPVTDQIPRAAQCVRHPGIG